MAKTITKKPGSESISSVPLRRAFGVIELVTMEPRGLTASEVAEHLNLPLVTAYRLLQRLNDLGILEGKGRNTKYIVGARLSRIAQTINGNRSIVDLARPIVQTLAEEFGVVAYLAGLFEFEAFLLLAESPRKMNAPFVHPGRQFKIHASAGGKALLAFQPGWIVRQLLERPLERFTERTITGRDAFLAHLDAIKAQGYAISSGESEPGLWGIACPVIEGGGTVSYSLGLISFLSSIDDVETFTMRTASHLQQAAKEIAALVADEGVGFTLSPDR